MRHIGLVLLAMAVAIPLLAQNDPEFLAGKAAMQKGDADRAVELLEKAVAKRPNVAEYHYWLGNAYGTAAEKASLFRQATLGKKAKEELERAVALDPNYVDARMGLLEFYLQAPGIIGGSVEKAQEQAAEIRKHDALLGHRAYARIYNYQKKPDLARNEWLAAVKEQPASARAHNSLAGFYLGVDKNYAAAWTEAETALKTDPSYMPALFRLGQIAANSGTNLPRGEESLKRYLAYQPKEGEPSLRDANYWLGMVYEKGGRKAEARASYAAALKLSPESKQIQEALKRVGG